MARRPDPCPSAFEQVLLKLDYAPSMANPIASDYKLIVPVVLKALGSDKIAAIMSQAQTEYGLNSSIEWYKIDAKACIEWAEDVLKEYNQRRHHTG